MSRTASAEGTKGHLPAFEPFKQKERGARNCQRCTVCAYCGDDLTGEHDHDHAPIPWRHGGREVVAACHRCHTLKDRIDWNRWPPAAVLAAESGALNTYAIYWPALRALETGIGDPSISRDEAIELLGLCTTAEARLWAAICTAKCLDEAKRRKESA